MANDENPATQLSHVFQQLLGDDGGPADRVRHWQRVLAGVRDGTLGVRTPVSVVGAPPWVTHEITSGELAAGGELQDHERLALTGLALTGLAKGAGGSERTRLNLHFFQGAGRPELEQMLRDGRFRVNVPEEAALLIVVWLLQQGEAARAASLLEIIAPFFDRLRFYPVPELQPRGSTSGAHLRTVDDVIKRLRAKRPNVQVDTMREALTVWAPLYDRIVALFLETVDGACPNVVRTPTGALARGPRGQLTVVGGWPCQRVSPEWVERARALLATYEDKRVFHRSCRKHEDPKENFARLRGYLDRWVHGTTGLTSGEVQAIRTILASIVARQSVSQGVQRQDSAEPTHFELAQALAERLAQYPRDAGLATLDAVLEPAAQGRPLAAPIARKALRCLEAPLPVLVRRGVLTSSDTLAEVLPGLTAHVRSARVRDPAIRRVFESCCDAYDRKSSLVCQAQLGELPWIQALSSWVGTDDTARESARATLCQVAILALDTFPQAIFSNRLVKELRVLSTRAGLSLPYVDELSADAFTGDFSETHLRAAQAAARLLRGSLYERYYGLPYERVLQLDTIELTRSGMPVSRGFGELCCELAGLDAWPRTAARKATVLEQAQILTTQNLAILFEALALSRGLSLLRLSCDTFEWVCRRQQRSQREPRAQLRSVKSTAFAWRQLVFYLSLLDGGGRAEFFDRSEAHLQQRRPELRQRLTPVIAGLRAIEAGDSFDAAGQHTGSGGRRLLGCSPSPHWLLTR